MTKTVLPTYLIESFAPSTRLLGVAHDVDEEAGDCLLNQFGLLFYEAPHFIKKEAFYESVFSDESWFREDEAKLQLSTPIKVIQRNGKFLWTFKTTIMGVYSDDPMVPVAGVSYRFNLVEHNETMNLHVVIDFIGVRPECRRIGISSLISDITCKRISEYLNVLSNSRFPCRKIIFKSSGFAKSKINDSLLQSFSHNTLTRLIDGIMDYAIKILPTGGIVIKQLNSYDVAIAV